MTLELFLLFCTKVHMYQTHCIYIAPCHCIHVLCAPQQDESIILYTSHLYVVCFSCFTFLSCWVMLLFPWDHSYCTSLPFSIVYCSFAPLIYCPAQKASSAQYWRNTLHSCLCALISFHIPAFEPSNFSLKLFCLHSSSSLLYMPPWLICASSSSLSL